MSGTDWGFGLTRDEWIDYVVDVQPRGDDFSYYLRAVGISAALNWYTSDLHPQAEC